MDLLILARKLNKIETKSQSRKWLYSLYAWEYKYGHLTTQRTQGFKENGSKTWWYTHKNLRAAYRTLSTTLEHLFLYLDNTNLRKDTNNLEGEFSHVKQKIMSHRGLKRDRKIAAVCYYIYFKMNRRKY